MRLLDLFCGAGGASMGYHHAGFDQITGVDVKPQPHYPFEFIQADALEYLHAHGPAFDLIHASPPCQAHSKLRALHPEKQYKDMIQATRRLLRATERPYIIENVPGAPLINPLTLCGTMFGLKVLRHRLFECHPPIYFAPAPCNHDYGRIPKTGRGPNAKGFITVAGHGGCKGTKKAWSNAMGIHWMTVRELAQAIPPAYTQFIGEQIISAITHPVPQ